VQALEHLIHNIEPLHDSFLDLRRVGRLVLQHGLVAL
jgi:hypothetical protein